jgi:hypothetical protein
MHRSHLLAFMFALALSAPALAQETGKWALQLNYAQQEHDKRPYNLSPHASVREWGDRQEGLGTYQWGISAHRRLLDAGRWGFSAGLGLSYELATFHRPFNYFYGYDGPVPQILLYADRYGKGLLQLPLQVEFRPIRYFALSLQILPQGDFLTTARNTAWDVNKGFSAYNQFPRWGFDFYSVELNPGIEFRPGRLAFALRYRAGQLRKFDRILFDLVHEHLMEKPRFETENLFKFWVSAGYRF